MTPPREKDGERQPPLVVMVHGLGRTTRMFRRMAAALEAAGFATDRYRYPSLRYGAAASAGMLRDYLTQLGEALAKERIVHLVGFSLGALLIRGALERPVPELNVGRIVLIGAPNRGVGILDGGGHRLARCIFGPAIDDMARGSPWIEGLGVPDHEIGVIAGDRAYPALSPAAHIRLLRGSRDDGPHDGTVEVRSTRLDGMTDFVVVHAAHTFLCQKADTIRQTVFFLKHGHFDKTPTDSAGTGPGEQAVAGF